MAVKSADRKPEKYIGPDGKPRIRMVPVDREVVKSEKTFKEMRRKQAAKKGMTNEAKDGDGVNIVKDRPFKGKPMKKEPDSGKGISFANMKKSKVAKDADANPNRAKAMGEAKDPEEYDKEGDMAKTQLKTMIDAAQELHDQLSDDENMPEWVQNKITKATDYIDSVRDYMKNNDDVNEALDRPGALDSYRKKAKMKSDKARNTATAKLLRGNPDISKEKETIRKREKGQDMADRVGVKQFRKSIGRGYVAKKEETVDEISNAKMGQYVRKAADDAARKGSKGDVVGARQRVKGVSKAMDKMDKNRLYGRQ